MIIRIILLLGIILMNYKEKQVCQQTPKQTGFSTKREALNWLDSAKFGMFVHWGLYAVPAGEWKSMEVPGNSEWIMHKAKIPVAEYEQLAKRFNPGEYNAEEWVKAIKAAGMQYIVITSKHHDGFAMFDSPSSEYDIVDATPYGKDPMKQLADACHKHGVKLGFYYSHDQDWHHPDGTANDWDFDPEKKDYEKFLNEKVKPQVRQLLTQYGPIFIIWFDTPKAVTPEQSKELVDLVHELQPSCLVSDRVGHGMGDYVGFGDHQVPGGVLEGVWETVGTTNESWGYKTSDQKWKSPELIIKLLTNIVSKGGVYLLNVGPDAKGNLPQPAVDSLKAVGDWLKINAEAVYGTGPSPFPKEYEWGTITTRPGKMYIHLYEWPEQGIFRLKGFNSGVEESYFLSNPDRKFIATSTEGILKLELPEEKPQDILYVPVVVVETTEAPVVDTTLTNDLQGVISLPSYMANLYKTGSSTLRVEGGGITFGYFDEADQMSWDFQVDRPGQYDFILYTAVGYWSGWLDSMVVTLRFRDQEFTKELQDVGRLENLSTLTWQDVPMQFGTVDIEETGSYTLRLDPEQISHYRNQGLRVRRIELVPAEMNYVEKLAKQFIAPIYPEKDANDAFLEKMKVTDN